VVNGIWQFHSLAAWRVLHGTSTPYVLFTHGMLDPWFKQHYPLKHLKKWMYWPWAEYRVLRDARAVLFTCDEERRLARRSFWLYRCNEVVVNYGTAQPLGDAQREREKFLEHHPELRGKRLILFVGRIHPKKGCDLLIEAFAAVLGKYPDWHLVMAGPDQVGWRQQLEWRATELGIAGRITWTGMISGTLKWGALRAAEVLVLPSHQENFGIVVAEALAVGVPALISNKVNIWREIAADDAGMVAPDSLAGTCQLLRSYLELPTAARLAMRDAARRCFARRFEIKQAARGLQSVLAGLGAMN
jgi:glycosyltransferase involved in cell wall biosynthesis